MRKHRNDVFFFTLIDLLIQALFVGLLVGMPMQRTLRTAKMKQMENERLQKDVRDLLAAHGVSNLQELNDRLTRMTPAHALVELHGGLERVKNALAAVDRAGGVEKLEKQFGAPPCESLRDKSGRLLPISIATVRVSDDHIDFEDERPSQVLLDILGKLGFAYEDVRTNTLDEFSARFRGPAMSGPDACRHFVQIRVCTELLKPMDVVHSSFGPVRRLHGC